MNKREEFLEKLKKESEETDINALMNNIIKIPEQKLVFISHKQLSELQIQLYDIIRYDVLDDIKLIEQIGYFFITIINLKYIIGFNSLSLSFPNNPESRVNYMLQNLEIYGEEKISSYKPAIVERHIDAKTLYINLIGRICLLQNELMEFLLKNSKGYIIECIEECMNSILIIMKYLNYDKKIIRKAINVKIHEFEDEYVKEI